MKKIIISDIKELRGVDANELRNVIIYEKRRATTSELVEASNFLGEIKQHYYFLCAPDFVALIDCKCNQGYDNMIRFSNDRFCDYIKSVQ